MKCLYSPTAEIGGDPNFKSGQFTFFWLALAMLNLCTKFEMSIVIPSTDRSVTKF